MTISGEKLLADLDLVFKNIRGRYIANSEMSKITWFRTGGLAEIFYQPADEEDLSTFLKSLPADIPLTIVGIGSNLLVRDGGIKGVVLRLSNKGFSDITQINDTTLNVGAAASDKRLAAAALDANIAGFHFYHGIPGAVGGALRMNGGANGVETNERVVEVRAMDRQGEIHILSNKDMKYAYRHSGAPNELIFLSAVMEGTKGNKDAIKAAMDEVASHRESVQPIREKTGGSTFRNPDGTSAWKVIDEAGCRGLRIGGAMMSEMHCNFMINANNASAYDLELLGETVRARVFEHSGLKLHWEIKRIGSFLSKQLIKPFLGLVSE